MQRNLPLPSPLGVIMLPLMTTVEEPYRIWRKSEKQNGPWRPFCENMMKTFVQTIYAIYNILRKITWMLYQIDFVLIKFLWMTQKQILLYLMQHVIGSWQWSSISCNMCKVSWYIHWWRSWMECTYWSCCQEMINWLLCNTKSETFLSAQHLRALYFGIFTFDLWLMFSLSI